MNGSYCSWTCCSRPKREGASLGGLTICDSVAITRRFYSSSATFWSRRAGSTWFGTCRCPGDSSWPGAAAQGSGSQRLHKDWLGKGVGEWLDLYSEIWGVKPVKQYLEWLVSGWWWLGPLQCIIRLGSLYSIHEVRQILMSHDCLSPFYPRNAGYIHLNSTCFLVNSCKIYIWFA